MPGNNINYYKDGISPCHTKPFFTQNKIMTIHSIILANILNFMHKHSEFKNLIPPPVFDIISSETPKYNHVNANMGSFTYYVITEGRGGSSMITLHVIVTWVSTVKVITEGRGVKIVQKLIT